MCVKSKVSVQNDTEEARSDVDPNFLSTNERAGSEVLSLDQVEKGHTSLLSAFKFNFHSWLQINMELTTVWAAASASSFLTVVLRVETSSAKRAITALPLSEEAKLLI